VDARADVYALGSVLYEMLAGEPPFTGPTAQVIAARLLTEPAPPVRRARPSVPEALERVIARALAKLPADRFATAAQFAEALTRPGATGTKPVATVAMPAAPRSAGIRSRLREPVTLALAGVALASLVGLAATLLRRSDREAAAPIVRFEFTGSDSARVVANFPWDAAISPDGRQLVYTVQQPSGTWLLYLRRSDQLEGHPIAGTLNGSQALFSPDGRWLAYQI